MIHKINRSHNVLVDALAGSVRQKLLLIIFPPLLILQREGVVRQGLTSTSALAFPHMSIVAERFLWKIIIRLFS